MFPVSCSFEGALVHGAIAAIVAALVAIVGALGIRKQVSGGLIAEALVAGAIEGVVVSMLICYLGERGSGNLDVSGSSRFVGASVMRVPVSAALGIAAGMVAHFLGVRPEWCPIVGACVSGFAVSVTYSGGQGALAA